MKRFVRHIIVLLLLVLSGALSSYAQNVRYVQQYSIHALTVPENPDFSFEWSIYYDGDNYIAVDSTGNVTENISWDVLTTYHVSVRPLIDSVGCYGEFISMDVIVVQYLSLHTFDDIYYTDVNVPIDGDVSLNDFDETGASIYYNSTPVSGPSKGTVILNTDGTFTYTPFAGETGIDYFVYEAHSSEMYSNALVTIVIEDASLDADLHIEKTGPAKALYGEEIVYTINVRNDGPNVAENVMLRDTLAFGLFNPRFAVGIGDIAPWYGEVSLGNMNSGDEINIYIFTTISVFAPQFIYNQALTYSDIYDSENEDNESIWMTEISNIYVDLPDVIHASSCDTMILNGFSSKGRNDIASYVWSPTTGLSDPYIANPVFTPDENTIGQSNLYTLTITDVLRNVAVDTTYIIVGDLPLAIIEGDTLYKDLGVNVMASGSESIGENLDFWWSTDNGNIVSTRTNDSIEVNIVGQYTLQVTDNMGCEAFDTIEVLLQSYPPKAVNDTLVIEAGTDSTINVLLNDSDINGFELKMTGIVTPPQHSTVLYNDETGLFTIQPDIDYWRIDSIEYQVCNNGIPVKCSTAWIIIDSKRPPLNADVFIMKTGDDIAFWGDTIHYSLTVSSNGPDSATLTTIFDEMNTGFYDPEYSLDGGITWDVWNNSRYNYTDSLRPGIDAINIHIRANIRLTADSVIYNKAYIETDIIENNLENDTSIWLTRIKELVFADAGRDTTIGDCMPNIDLGAYESTGRNLKYYWTPTDYLSNPNSVNPTFDNPGAGLYTYVLTVIDDDGISDTDEITITVLPPPLADAGPDRYMIHGGNKSLIGEGSTGTFLSYFWETTEGHIIPGQEYSKNPVVDTIGVYYLTVTDSVGCIDHDSVEVFWFYFDPFVVPDYYSVLPGQTLTGENVLENDYEPNALFNMIVTPGRIETADGGFVDMKVDGSFEYTPPSGYNGHVDYFSYEVCNDNEEYVICKSGYVQITVNFKTNIADVNITKVATSTSTLAGRQLEYKLTVKNYGPNIAKNVLVTDSLSYHFENDAQYKILGGWSSWSGAAYIGDLLVGQEKEIFIKATVKPDAPSAIFNAATAAAQVFDDNFNWFDPEHRNVDTISVAISSDLLADAELLEQLPSDVNKHDGIIGACDDRSKLSASGSGSTTLEIESYEWSPRQFLTNPDDIITGFRHPGIDTTIIFTLKVEAGNKIEFDEITVHFSAPINTNAGGDRKMNEGEVLILDATASVGAGVKYDWYIGVGNTHIYDFYNDDPLQPYVYEPEKYFVYGTDMHGCTDIDSAVVSENQLFVISDILVVVESNSVTANVRTNDYDPDLDSIIFNGEIIEGPFSGSITGGQIELDGTYTYTPNNNYTGSDYFTYRLCDNNVPQLCDTATVYIHVIDVLEPNSPPVANHDHLFVNKGKSDSTNILANDYDYDGGIVTFSQFISQPSKGSVSIDENGLLIYTAAEGKSGYDSFTYQICDNGSPTKCDVATVNVYIHKLEENRPVAVDDAYYAVVKTISGNVLNNDYDPDGDELLLTTEPISGPANGDFVLAQDGTFIYTPNDAFEGTDIIVYEVCERYTDSQYCTQATLYITSLDETRYATDVAITKTGPDPAEALSGSVINYELKVSIDGPTLANDVVVSDTLFNGLRNLQFSLDQLLWNDWDYSFTFDQLLLYQDTVIYIRATIPDVFSGQLINGASVDHVMTELDEDDNYSEVATEVFQSVIANAGSDTIIGACNDFELNGSGSLGMNMIYSWTPTNFLNDPTLANPIYTPQSGQTTEFMLVITSTINGLVDVDTSYVTVTVADDVIARAGEDPSLEIVQPVFLDGRESTGTGNLSYLWYKYSSEEEIDTLSTNDTLTIYRSGVYYLQVFDEYGCSDIDRVNVVYPVDDFIAVDDYIETPQETPVDIYILRNDIIDFEDSYNLDLLFVNDFPKNGEVIERPYDSIFTYVPKQYYYGPDSFTYIVSTQYFTDQATVYIEVTQKKPDMPNAFSPNGDNVNDFLLIENIELYESNLLLVFNRWGSMVYEKSKYDNSEPWDGIANKGIRIGNGPLPTGVYYYILDLGDDLVNKEDRYYKGYIYIASDNRR